jgi:hypothetical protein
MVAVKFSLSYECPYMFVNKLHIFFYYFVLKTVRDFCPTVRCGIGIGINEITAERGIDHTGKYRECVCSGSLDT